MRNSAQGFTLVELLVVIAIVAILAAVVILIINPLELLARGRDTVRISDLENIQKAITTALADSTGAPAATLCFGLTAPCSGLSTDVSAKKNDGTGWAKVNFAGAATLTVSTLPQDPTNTATYHYTYYSDGTNFELNAVLESNQLKGKMLNDGGDNDNVYEVGSKLALLH